MRRKRKRTEDVQALQALVAAAVASGEGNGAVPMDLVVSDEDGKAPQQNKRQKSRQGLAVTARAEAEPEVEGNVEGEAEGEAEVVKEEAQVLRSSPRLRDARQQKADEIRKKIAALEAKIPPPFVVPIAGLSVNAGEGGYLYINCTNTNDVKFHNWYLDNVLIPRVEWARRNEVPASYTNKTAMLGVDGVCDNMAHYSNPETVAKLANHNIMVRQSHILSF